MIGGWLRFPPLPPGSTLFPPPLPPPTWRSTSCRPAPIETRAALAVQGGSFRDKRHFAATAVLIQHPKGDLLIDAGFGSHVAEHVAMLPRLVRAPYQVLPTVAAQLGPVATTTTGCSASW